MTYKYVIMWYLLIGRKKNWTIFNFHHFLAFFGQNRDFSLFSVLKKSKSSSRGPFRAFGMPKMGITGLWVGVSLYLKKNLEILIFFRFKGP